MIFLVLSPLTDAVYIGSSFNVEAAALSQTRNPFEGNLTAIAKGRELFLKNCAVCHASDARGKIGPDLTDREWRYGNSDSELFTTIAYGRPGGMPNFETALGDENIWRVITYLRTIERKYRDLLQWSYLALVVILAIVVGIMLYSFAVRRKEKAH